MPTTQSSHTGTNGTRTGRHDSFTIADRSIGEGHACYIIAELSANHGGSIERAADIIRAAAVAGVDAVKLQTYTADTLTIDSSADCFQINHGTLWDGTTLYDLYRDAAMPWEWQPELKRIANDLGLALFSSPFDDSSVDFLEKMNVPAYKIASFEIVDTGLLKRVAATGKPVIVSTGMATETDIALALKTLREGGSTEIALLKCTSAYPAPQDSMNLKTIADMKERFDVQVGLSDHTHGHLVATTAVAMGATVIEKHLTLSRDDGGPDAAFSMEPDEFADLVCEVRKVEAIAGKIAYGTGTSDSGNTRFRRSLFVVQDIAAGEPFTKSNVRSIRPGHGLAPQHFDEILARCADSDLKRGTPLAWEHVS